MKKISIIILLAAICFTALFFMDHSTKYENVADDHANLPRDLDNNIKINFSADKNVYRSSEEMELKAASATNAQIENLTVKVYGIKDSGGRYRVNGERLVNVDPPGKTETFTFRMPSCYGCAGVSAGEYAVVMEIEKNGTMISNTSVIINLQK